MTSELPKSNANPVRSKSQKTLAENGANKASNGVRKVLPAIVLATTFYYSFLLALGLFLGYFGCKFFYKKFVETGKIDNIYVDFGKWKFHFHHWIMGAIFLALVWIIDWLYLPKFFVGVIGGIIAHDIYDFNDWYRIIIKDKSHKNKELIKK